MEIIVNRNTVLFDMNDTLTGARSLFASFLSSPLWNLGQIADIGRVTGFDLDYVQFQSQFITQNQSIPDCLPVLLSSNGGK